MTKTRQDNYVTNCIDAVYTENEIDLSWPIKPCLVSDKN